jgi:predicted transcriptional regulator YdeE/GNAT superfamily N-acetyltransferase
MRTPFTILSVATALVSSPLLGQNAPHISDKTNFTEENTMGTHEVVQKPAILVIGIDCRTSNAPEAGPQDIPKLWGRFYGEDIKSRIPNKTSNEVIALYCDYEGDYTQPYSVVIGCPVSSIDAIPEGMVAKTIPASSYAIFRATGEHPKALIETWGNIWKQPNLERTYTSDFELYGNKFMSGSPKEVEVYIGVNSKEDALLQSVMQGRFDTFRSGSICSPLPEADFKETDQNCLYAWGMDYVCDNGVMEKNGERIPTEEEIDKAIEYFSSKNLPFMWWSSAKILETKGFQFGGILTGIALDISQGLPSKPASSSDLRIKIVQSDSELKAFTELAANAFAMSPKATEQWLALNDSVMKKNEQIHFMAYLNGVPVGTATLSIAPSSAGIWNLATLPEYRKHGIGGALVHAALVEAKKQDHDQVMAILMPKGMAWGLFTKMGFKAACEFPFYIYGVSAEELEK